jgi:hypothetical protein
MHYLEQARKDIEMNTIASHPLMGQGVLGQTIAQGPHTGSLTGAGILAQTASSVKPRPPWHTQGVVRISVEKVDNGYIMRSSKNEGELAKVKICTNMDELKDLFVATLIEHQLEQ